MRKKILILFLTLICSVALAAGIAACSGSELDDLIAQGYTIQVTYDANGGNFGEPGLTYRMDLFNPDTLEEDDDGYIRIKLQDFADRSVTGTAYRPNATRDSYGFWGWYQTKEVYLDENGEVKDYNGNVLSAEEDLGLVTYYYVNGKGEKVESEPIYTYSDPWDFDTDVIEYKKSDYAEGELFEMTLYAAWVPDFEFDYYYKNEKGEYVLYGTTSFNYATQQQNGTMADRIWVPEFPEEGGGMSYTHSETTYSYTFPKLSGYTFKAAYYDEDGGKTEIETYLAHTGYVTDGVVAVNHVMNIYVEFDEGEIYHIKTATQFRDCATTTSYLIIYEDLDFAAEGVNWPSTLDIGTFTGRIWTADGEVKTLSNITVRHQTESATLGGLFGRIGAGAEITGIEFRDVTFDLYTLGRTVSGAYIGLFAGDIESKAELCDVSLSGRLEFKIGAVSTSSNGNWINLLSNADLDSFGVGLDGVTEYVVSCYSNTSSAMEDGSTSYWYGVTVLSYDEEAEQTETAVTVGEDLDITFVLYTSNQNYYYRIRDDEGSELETLYYEEGSYVVYYAGPSASQKTH